MIIRTVTQGDVPEIIRLSKLCGFAERSEDGLRWVLFNNPVQGNHPPGLVAVRNGEVLAFMGSSVHRLHGTQSDRIVVCGHTFVSHPASPGAGIRIIKHGLTVTPAEATYTLHNNALSALIYKRVGLTAAWQASGRQYVKKRLEWSIVFLSATLRRIAKIELANRLLLSREWFNKRPKSGEAPLVKNVRRFDPFKNEDAKALDAFDEHLAASGKIIGSRAARIWQYRLKDPDRKTPTELYAIFDDKGLAALLATSISKDNELSVVTLDIEDLVFRPGCESLLEPMLRQSVKCARHARAARIMWRVLPPNLDMATADYLGFKARPRSYDSCHFGGDTAWSPLSWEVSPFDGDFWFALRRPPGQ